MADVNKLAPLIFGWEGGWADNKADKGGKTNMGVTLSTWKGCGYDKDGDGDIDADDLKLLTKADVVNKILKPHYWDRWKADAIKNQSIANILVDWVWASGKWGIVKPQAILLQVADGEVGPATLNAINSAPQAALFSKIAQARRDFVEAICKRDPSQLVFRKGWLNRINSFQYLGS